MFRDNCNNLYYLDKNSIRILKFFSSKFLYYLFNNIKWFKINRFYLIFKEKVFNLLFSDIKLKKLSQCLGVIYLKFKLENKIKIFFRLKKKKKNVHFFII